ncbi:hypothetical protein APV28_0105 [Comamonas testosteroni]|nr:hypothetical protein APV28_0105 [Comamonas testosteroni]
MGYFDQYFSCDATGDVSIAELIQNDGEFITPKPIDCVRSSNAAVQMLCNLLQHDITRPMTKAVVDALEVVQVQ